MDKTIMNWAWCKPVDVIALAVIFLGFVAMIFGVDGSVRDMVALVIAFYFGAKSTITKEL